jgi:hypothetical protein
MAGAAPVASVETFSYRPAATELSASEIFRRDGTYFLAIAVLTRPRCLALEFRQLRRQVGDKLETLPGQGRVSVLDVVEGGKLYFSFEQLYDGSARINGLNDLSLLRQGQPTSLVPCSHTSQVSGSFATPHLDGARLFHDRASCESSLADPRILPRTKPSPPDANVFAVRAGEWCWSVLGYRLDRRFEAPPE